MKKLLFLLLSTCAMYGQVSTGQEQDFDYGIKNNAAQTVTSAVNLVTQGADGTYGKITFDNLTNRKAFLSTGLIKNGLITINADPTKYNISAGIGIISNFDDPQNPVSTLVNFSAITGHIPAYLNTGNITYVAINSSGAIVESASQFTTTQRRDLIILGAVIHSNLISINVVNNIAAPSNAIGNQLHDFMEAIGALNLTGNKYTAAGANLQLNKSAGTIFKFGVNFATDWKNPHELAQANGTSLTFRYRTQNGTEGSDRINLDPSLYDVSNVLTAVPNNKFTIQTVTMFQTGLTRIQYGQNVYDDLASAQAAVFTRDFVVENNILMNGITRAYIIVKNNATSLQSATDAKIIEAQKFGGVASGGVALTFANIVSALGYTPENVANKATDFSVVNNTLYPSIQAVKTYADGLVVGLLDDRGTYNASSNLFPSTGGSGTSGAILKGDIWYVGTAGTLGGKAVAIGDSFRAIADSPGQTAGNWALLSSNLSYVPENQANKSDSYTTSSSTTYSSTKALVDGLSTKPSITGSPAIGQISFWNSGTLLDGDSNLTWDDTSKTFGSGIGIPLYKGDFRSVSGYQSRFSTLDTYGDGAILIGSKGVSDPHYFGELTWTQSSQILHLNAESGEIRFGTSLSGIASSDKMIIKMDGTVSINNLSGTGTRTVVADASGNLSATSTAGVGYKVYTALLTQTGTSAPTATVLDNTLGGTISWAYTSIGVYTGTLTGAFTASKTIGFTNVTTDADETSGFVRLSSNQVELRTRLGGAYTDGIFQGGNVEIRVYP